MDSKKIYDGLRTFLEGLEIDDPLFDLKSSTEKMAHEWSNEFLSGYFQEPAAILTSDDEPVDGMLNQIIMIKKIPFVSFCIHHFVPIHGEVTIGYFPDQKIVGFSKIVRLVQCFARRLQLQERMTHQIAEAIMVHLQPKGAACYVKADQFCMIARGVKINAKTITTEFKGVFEEQTHYQTYFLNQCD